MKLLQWSFSDHEEPSLPLTVAVDTLSLSEGSVRALAQTGWPVIFRLPTFPVGVQKELDAKNSMFHSSGKTKSRNDLVRSLVDAISIHTW